MKKLVYKSKKMKQIKKFDCLNIVHNSIQSLSQCLFDYVLGKNLS